MEDLKIYTLCSSSKGNSLFVRYKNTRILIDVGKSAKGIMNALYEIGENIANIDAIFITHAHSDHTTGIEALEKCYNLPIHTTENTAAQIAKKRPDCYSRLIRHEDRFSQKVEEITVNSFVTPHDCPGCCGYTLDFEGSDYRFGICTDTGCISVEMVENLKDCNGCIVEANYDEQMLKNGSYPPFLKKRISANTGHLSNKKCAELVCILAERGVKKFMLGHISPENNTPESALKESCRALIDKGYTDVDITVADRYLPTEF